jgi:hypothetical protein
MIDNIPTFLDIWDELENEERVYVLSCINRGLRGNWKITLWRPCEEGSIDRRIYNKISKILMARNIV